MTTIVIPARGGSKRIPHKNLVDLNGKPLISYAITSSLKVTDEVYVSTDCAEIEKVSIAYGAKVIKRPIEISTDLCRTESAIEHFLTEVDNVDVFACVQCTTPLMDWHYLRDGFDMIRSDKFDSVVSVCERAHYYWTSDGKPINFSVGTPRNRTQDMEKYYEENGAFYITTKESFVANQCLYDGTVGLVITPNIISLDIDNVEDLNLISAILKI